MNTLTPAEAKAFYDSFGAKQDQQGFYEKRALDALCANSEFENARSIFEFGCGTGSLAVNILENFSHDEATYVGTDISDTMIELAEKRLAPFSSRASVSIAKPEPLVLLDSQTVDRFVSTYVFDLLSVQTQQDLLNEAQRVLKPSGMLCLAGITPGFTLLSKLVMGTWQKVFERYPRLVGGCRPSRCSEGLVKEGWRIKFSTAIVAWGVASEVVIAYPPVRNG